MKKIKNGLKIFIGFSISIIFMYFAFRNVEIHQMMSSLKGINYYYLFLIFVSILISDWLRALRWQYFLLPISRVDIGSLFSAIRIGYAANAFLPARLGDLLRAIIIGRKKNISTSSTFATIVTEKIADMFSLLVLMAVSLVIYPFPSWVTKSGLIIFLFTMIFFGLLILIKKHTQKAIYYLQILLKPLKESGRAKVLSLFESFLAGFTGFGGWKQNFIVTILSFLIWFCFILVFVFGFYAFDFTLPWFAPLVIMVITTISIIIPSSPGYIGTYHLLCQRSLEMFGIATSPALAFAFIVHGINIFPFFILGLFFAWKEGVNFSRMKNPLQNEEQTVNKSEVTLS